MSVRSRMLTKSNTNRPSKVHYLPPSFRFPPLREGNRAGVRFPLPAGGTCRRGFEKFCSARSAFACTRSPDCRPRSAFACTRSPDCRPRSAFACTRSPDCRPRSAFACTRSPDCSTQRLLVSRWLARYASSQRLELESADDHFHLASVGGRRPIEQPQVHARVLVARGRYELPVYLPPCMGEVPVLPVISRPSPAPPSGC
jgi:hypothetical protein